MELRTEWEKDGEFRGIKIGKMEGKIEGKKELARTFIGKFIAAQFTEEGTALLATVMKGRFKKIHLMVMLGMGSCWR